MVNERKTADTTHAFWRVRKLALLLIAAITIPFIAIGAYWFWRGTEAKSWPTVEAKVTGAQPAVSSMDRRGVDYRLRVSFTYAINGKQYRSSDTSGDEYRDREEAGRNRDKWKPGTTVQIHYNPLTPEIAVLDPESYLGTGVAFLLVEFIILLPLMIVY